MRDSKRAAAAEQQKSTVIRSGSGWHVSRLTAGNERVVARDHKTYLGGGTGAGDVLSAVGLKNLEGHLLLQQQMQRARK